MYACRLTGRVPCFVRNSSRTESTVAVGPRARSDLAAVVGARAQHVSGLVAGQHARRLRQQSGRPLRSVHEGCRRCDTRAALLPFERAVQVPEQRGRPMGKGSSFTRLDPDTLENLYVLPTSGEITPKVYVAGPGSRCMDRCRQMANGWRISSNDSGTPEIYTQSFPAPGRRVRISTAGGGLSWWTRDGRHIVLPRSEEDVADDRRR